MAFLLFTYEANCFSEKQPFQYLDSITDMNTVDTNWHIVVVATFTSLVNNINLATLRMCEVETILGPPFTAVLHVLGAILCSGRNGCVVRANLGNENNVLTGRNSLVSLMKNCHVVAYIYEMILSKPIPVIRNIYYYIINLFLRNSKIHHHSSYLIYLVT